MKLYKTTVLVWTEYDPFGVPPHRLVYDATFGDGYLSGKSTKLVENPLEDPEFEGMEFFGMDEEDEEEAL